MLASVIVMGVLIVVGVAVLGITIVRRMAATSASPAAMPSYIALDEPTGTRMVAISAAGERIAVLLQGGGADRLILIEPQHGSIVGRVTLRPPPP